MQVGERIRQLREQRKLSGVQLAIRAELDQSYVSKLEKGKAGFSMEGLEKISKALNISVAELFGAGNVLVSEVRKAGGRVPLLDYIQAGSPAVVQSTFTDADVLGYVAVDFERVDDLFALQIRGTSMIPEFREGDIVIINRALRPQPGDFVVAQLEGDGEAMFKRYKVLETDAEGRHVFALVPLNDDYPTLRSNELAVSVVGTMVEHRRFRKR